VGSDAQAEDIAQEVFVRAYAHFDQLRTSATSGFGSKPWPPTWCSIICSGIGAGGLIL
jgi:hypothetical protein